MAAASVVLPYVNIYQSRRRKFGYYRRDGLRLRIEGSPGTPEFLSAYRTIHERFERAHEDGVTVSKGTLAELIARYLASPEWRELKPSTQKDYEKSIRRLREDFGDGAVATMTRQDVRVVRDHYMAKPARNEGDPPIPTPTRANKTITILSVLLRFAMEVGMTKINPALRPKRLRTTGGYKPWTTEQVQHLMEAEPNLRFPVILALATGQRGADVVRMTWKNYDGNAIEVVQGKTGALVWIPCHPELKAELDRMPRSKTTILVKPGGSDEAGTSEWSVSQFQTMVSKAIRRAGLRGMVWHGLRHTAATWLAELGCTERDIMAITGHKTSAMVGKYVAHADQRLRATRAITKLSGRRIEKEGNNE